MNPKAAAVYALAALAALLLLLSTTAETKCTAIGVGNLASEDGSVMVAHTDDAGNGASDLRLVRVPAKDHEPGSRRPVYQMRSGYPRIVSESRGGDYTPKANQVETTPMGYIDQVNHTYAYWDQDYALMNEFQLAIAESTCGARTQAKSLASGGKALLDIDELSKIALERCRTARCAIQTMGRLGQDHGFYAEPEPADSGEALIVADADGEVWNFHILPTPDGAGAVWAAQRVPDDHVTVVANDFVIQEMDLEDSNGEDNLFSDNMVSTAVDQGWYDDNRNEAFNFFRVFGFEPKTFDPILGLYSGRRMWRVNSLLNSTYEATVDPYVGYVPSQSPSPTYPATIMPDEPVSVAKIMEILGDHYEGTPFDLTKGPAAGPFGNPNRFEGPAKGLKGGFERPISIYRGTFSFVAQSRSDRPDFLGTIWYGQDQPAGSVWVPIYAGQKSLPQEMMWAKQSEFNYNSNWWAFNFVNNWMQLGYSKMVEDVNAARANLQHQAFEIHKMIIKASQWVPEEVHDNVAASAILTKMSNSFARYVGAEWWELSYKLIAKYSNGLVTTGEEANERKAPGYPKWWLKDVGYDQWPPTNPSEKHAHKKQHAHKKPCAHKKHAHEDSAQSAF